MDKSPMKSVEEFKRAARQGVATGVGVIVLCGGLAQLLPKLLPLLVVVGFGALAWWLIRRVFRGY